MWSRRQFIFATLSSLSIGLNCAKNPVFAFGKKAKTSKRAPRLIEEEYWPTAISCNYIDVFDNNLCCIADENGRLVTADILSSVGSSHTFPVMGEIHGLGDKILFLSTVKSQYAVVIAEKHASKKSDKENTSKRKNQVVAPEQQFVCHLVNLSSPRTPNVVSSSLINSFAQIDKMAVSGLKNRIILVVSGIDRHGDHKVSLLGIKGKGKLTTISSFKTTEPAKFMALGSDSLIIIHPSSQASIYTLNHSFNAQAVRKITLPEEVTHFTTDEDICAWSSQQGNDCIVEIANLNEFPKARSHAKAKGLYSIEALAVKDRQILALGTGDENSAVIPFTIDKNDELRKEEAIRLNGYVENSTASSRLVLGKNAGFISSGWPGVQALSVNHKNIWMAATCYSQQKLPVAGLNTWSEYMLLAGGDIELYSLSRSGHVKLLDTVKLDHPIKAAITAGSYVICLGKDGLSLRKIDKPGSVIVKTSISGEQMSYDKVNHKAYIIESSQTEELKRQVPEEKFEKIKTPDGKKNLDDLKTEEEPNKAEPNKLTEFTIYNNSIEKGKSFSILAGAYCSSADEGFVLVGSIDELAIYKVDQENELVCKREFKNYAWRDIILSKGNIYATAVDQNVNGYFLTMSFDGQSINALGSIKLPHDGLSLTVKDDVAFAVGQDSEGNSILSSIDISNSNNPKIMASRPAIQSASAVSTNEDLILVAGQGFQIFST